MHQPRTSRSGDRASPGRRSVVTRRSNHHSRGSALSSLPSMPNVAIFVILKILCVAFCLYLLAALSLFVWEAISAEFGRGSSTQETPSMERILPGGIEIMDARERSKATNEAFTVAEVEFDVYMQRMERVEIEEALAAQERVADVYRLIDEEKKAKEAAEARAREEKEKKIAEDKRQKAEADLALATELAEEAKKAEEIARKKAEEAKVALEEAQRAQLDAEEEEKKVMELSKDAKELEHDVEVLEAAHKEVIERRTEEKRKRHEEDVEKKRKRVQEEMRKKAEQARKRAAEEKKRIKKEAAANKEKKPRNGVMILGMHRSGTSMLAGLMVTGMGYNAGGPLIKPAADNKKGFFERIDVVNQNDEFFRYQQMDWATNAIAYDADKALEQYKNKQLTFQQGAKALEFLNNKKNAPWLQKDPRMCITLLTWLELLNNEPVVLFTFRHPLEVAKSLKKRQKFPFFRGLRLWIVYNMRAIENSADLCRVYSSNDALLADPLKEVHRISDELSKRCGLPAPPRTLEKSTLDLFVDANLHHNKNGDKKDRLVLEKHGDCIVPEYDYDAEDGSPLQDLEKELYLKAMKMYCDFQSGEAYEDDYEWPILM